MPSRLARCAVRRNPSTSSLGRQRPEARKRPEREQRREPVTRAGQGADQWAEGARGTRGWVCRSSGAEPRTGDLRDACGSHHSGDPARPQRQQARAGSRSVTLELRLVGRRAEAGAGSARGLAIR